MLKQVGWCSRRHGEPLSPIFQMPDGSRQYGELLERPAQPHYAAMPREVRKTLLVETWIDAALHARSWPDRTVAFDQLIRELLDSDNKPFDSMRAARALMTVACEHLCEREFTTLDAAQLYRLTLHYQWHVAGETFLRHHGVAKVRKWTKLHPGFDRLSKVIA
jgi:metal-responsive CopG/Arc/MetJ family transcriptional regulator